MGLKRKKTLFDFYNEEFENEQSIYLTSLGKLNFVRYHFSIEINDFTTIYYSELKYLPYPKIIK